MSDVANTFQNIPHIAVPVTRPPARPALTLSLFGQPGYPPGNGTVMVLVLGAARRHLHQALLQRVHSPEDPLDALHLALTVDRQVGGWGGGIIML